MWSILFLARNLAKVSDEKGGPLSVDKPRGYPYCERSCSILLITVSAVFGVTLKMKENLLKTAEASRYSLLLNWKKSAARSCHGAWGTSRGSSGWIG